MVAMKFIKKSKGKCSAFIYSVTSVKSPQQACSGSAGWNRTQSKGSALREQIFTWEIENKQQANLKGNTCRLVPGAFICRY